MINFPLGKRMAKHRRQGFLNQSLTHTSKEAVSELKGFPLGEGRLSCQLSGECIDYCIGIVFWEIFKLWKVLLTFWC
jgi:hypothetical protein